MLKKIWSLIIVSLWPGFLIPISLPAQTYDHIDKDILQSASANRDNRYQPSASGIYFCKLEAFRTQVRKLILIK